MDEYKSNSHKSKEQKEVTDKKVEKVVTGDVTVRKKGGTQKLASAFISEDATNVKSYVLMDIIIPAAKEIIANVVKSSIDMILYGRTGGSKSSSSASRVSRVSYDQAYNRENRSTSRDRRGYDYDDIIIKNRGEAEDVLSRMDELIDVYKMASVADLYEFVGVSGRYTDCDYGWFDISSARVVPVNGGYLLKFPPARPLN